MNAEDRQERRSSNDGRAARFILNRPGREGPGFRLLAASGQHLDQTLRVGSLIFTRGAGSAIKLLLNIVLGRVLGSSGAGVYFLFFSWTSMLGEIEGLGLPPYTLRNVAVLEGEDRRNDSRRFLLAGIGLVLFLGGTFAGVVFALSPLLAGLFLESPQLAYVLQFAALASLLYIVIRITAQALTGRGQAITAILLENALLPAGLIALLLLGVLWIGSLNARFVLWGYLSISLLTLLIGLWIWLRRPGRPDPGGSSRAIWKMFPARNLATFWILGVVIMAGANLPFLLLPKYATASEIGQFGIAHRFVTIAGTFLQALSAHFAPRFAQEYEKKNEPGLRRNLRLSQVYSLLAYLPFVLAFLFFAGPLLGIVGNEFRAARDILLIMTIGQLFNAGTGLAGNYLVMSRHEHVSLGIGITTVIIMALLISWLGDLFGLLGVAWAFTITISVKYLLFYVASHISFHRLRTQGIA